MRNQELSTSKTLTVYGRTTKEVMKIKLQAFKIPTCMKKDSSFGHAMESWATCYDTFCKTHWDEKLRYNTFPWPDGRIPMRYEAEETDRFTQVCHQHEGYTVLQENEHEQPKECLEHYLPIEDCLSPACQIHQSAKVSQWHEEREKEEEARDKCGFRIGHCWDWNCTFHLENKQIALDQARQSELDENIARNHLKMIEGWEEELRRKKQEQVDQAKNERNHL
jgi:hypothetical protein